MNSNDENLIFLISLPRSGSTLLQRILSNQSQIASTSESWLLLPQIYALREGVSFAEYSHTTASRAINDFVQCMPRGLDDYLEVVANSFLKATLKVSSEAERYYLEKTPRNNLILPEILAMFPRARYIFLWRNPAAIAASMIESFAQGNWNLYHHDIDLDQGLANMLDARAQNIANSFHIKYEDLVTNPDRQLEGLFRFLDLPYDTKTQYVRPGNSLKGRMGDTTGVKMYSSVSTEPLTKWVSTFSNPLRRRWLRNYLTTVDSRKLLVAGYDIEEILSDLDKKPVGYRGLIGDAMRMLYGFLDSRFHLSLIRRQNDSKKHIRRYRMQ